MSRTSSVPKSVICLLRLPRVVTCSRLKVTRGVVALRDEDAVVVAAFERLVKRDRWPHKSFFDLAKSLESRL